MTGKSTPAAAASQISLEQAVKKLAEFAVEREDLKILLQTLPADAGLDKTALEYEFQFLKIVCAGWAISYFMENSEARALLAESFWLEIKIFSETISQLTATSSGIEINYFEVLKERADIYIKAINLEASEADPALAIGLTLADICGYQEQPLIITSGRRIFNVTLAGVKSYLESIEIMKTQQIIH